MQIQCFLCTESDVRQLHEMDFDEFIGRNQWTSTTNQPNQIIGVEDILTSKENESYIDAKVYLKDTRKGMNVAYHRF